MYVADLRIDKAALAPLIARVQAAHSDALVVRQHDHVVGSWYSDNEPTRMARRSRRRPVGG